MTIAEMHVWFRQYAQQMGMQNVRAILPEQIDVLINTSISDTVNQLVRENVGIRNDRVITDNSKIGQINALRSLYKVTKIIKYEEPTNTEQSANNTEKEEIDKNKHLVLITPNIGEFVCNNFITDGPNVQEEVNKLDTNGNIITDNEDNPIKESIDIYAIDNVMYLVDLSIVYKYSDTVTRPFPIRIIEDSYLADTLNDFILKPRVRTPIAIIYQNKLDLYLGDDYAKAGGQLKTGNVDLDYVRVSYIAAPAKVKYVSDVTGDTSQDIQCDLPESMHVDILKHAVDLYNVSINGGLYNAQQNQQLNQREMSRNEARPINEGYQN